MKSLKIGFSGPPGVGKSTLLKSISENIPNVITTYEPARIVIDLLGLEEDKTILQKSILSSFLTVELEVDKMRKKNIPYHFILDRAITDVFVFLYLYKIDKTLVEVFLEKIANMYKSGFILPYNVIYLLRGSKEFIEEYRDFYIKILEDNARKVMDEYSMIEKYINMSNIFSEISLHFINKLQQLSDNNFYIKLYEIRTEDFVLSSNKEPIYNILERRNKFIINDINLFIKEVGEDDVF